MNGLRKGLQNIVCYLQKIDINTKKWEFYFTLKLIILLLQNPILPQYCLF